MSDSPDVHASDLAAAVAEVEAHVGAEGWDRRPTLFGLVANAQLAADDPQLAERIGVTADAPGYTPIEQEPLPDGPLDESLGDLTWPREVVGCVLCQEIVVLPPSAESDVADGDVAAAGRHPQRREARLVAGVLRDGSAVVLLRLRPAQADDTGELLTGPDLAPNLIRALAATLD